MRFLGLGLQGKFFVALLASAALPLLIGLAVFENRAYDYYLGERGKLHELEALNFAREINEAADQQGKMLQIWLMAQPRLLEHAVKRNQELQNRPDDDLARHKLMLDESWAALPDDDPQLLEILQNPGARSLLQYKDINPEVAEILATDEHGCLLAATAKSTDYDQSDESWWQAGRALGKNERWTDMIRMDASSGVYSKDVVLPLHDQERFAGLVKITVDITSLFAEVGVQASDAQQRWDIMLDDGKVLACSEKNYVSLTKRIPQQTCLEIQRIGHGHIQTQDENGGSWLTGFHNLDPPGMSNGAHVLLSSMRDDVVAPLQSRMLQIGAFSIVILTLCAFIGFWLIQRNVLEPLSTLGRAARSLCVIAGTKPSPAASERGIEDHHTAAIRNLDAVAKIRTGDEIEPLARDFSEMSARLMSFRKDLETEIESRNMAARTDLELSRQHQRLLLPACFPNTSSPDGVSSIGLRFAGFHQPADDVGGDYFKHIQIDEHCAGILIADVMGHGSRSAVLAGILHGICREHATLAQEPGAFLDAINDRLHGLFKASEQTLFISAFLLVLDTRLGIAKWAVAGHPSPLRAKRGSDAPPVPLWKEPQHLPALGLTPKAVYPPHQSSLEAGDVFLLFTDGIIEAEHSNDGIFGLERLSRSFAEAVKGSLEEIPAAISRDVSAFRGGKCFEDDVCLIVVEACCNGVPAC